ncbi:MAG: O-antigen ligase family protein [Nitrospirales bacterium]|nr:O-antigen ligase family protein [Nitrospirales bacterium]
MHSSTIDNAQGVGSSGTKPFLKKQIPIKPDKLDKFLLAQVAWCTVPALLFVRIGLLEVGSFWSFTFLGAFLARYALKGNMPAFVALTVASLPAFSYTREIFFYNSVLLFLGVGLGLWFLRSPKECARFWDNRIIRLFFITGAVYWIVTVLLTRQYYSNLMVMEMLCSAGSVYLLGRHPRYLASALTGMSIAILSVAMGMIGLGGRLGEAYLNGIHVGNPYLLGFPTALVLLLAVADNGKWLFMQHFRILKNVLIAMCGIILLLTTSRGSWLVALVGIVVIIFFQSQQRRKIFFALLLMGCVLVGVLQTKSGEKVSEYFEMATGSERTLKQMTTGRADMWVLFPKVLADSPIWGVGPGSGKEAYAQYSWVDKEVTFRPGKELAWHAIYLHVGVETGMIGLIILTGFLGTLIFRGLRYRLVTGNIVPLIGILGFMTIGMSVVGIDAISGIYLGLAFLGTTFPPKAHRRENSNFS